MEALNRKPFQGVTNILRFNWHYFLAAGASGAILFGSANLFDGLMFWMCIMFAIGIITSTSFSLFVSYYVYDRSRLYDFVWLAWLKKNTPQHIVNIHAGFDETSSILKQNFPYAMLQVCDFYDPDKHTEISIKRARNAYPPYDGTIKVTTSRLYAPEMSQDIIFNIFALHEVRNREERVHFLGEQVRILKHNGKIVVVEHLLDTPNFLAYNIGFFHFFSAREWESNFQHAGLLIYQRFKITPFITIFVLTKVDGNTP